MLGKVGGRGVQDASYNLQRWTEVELVRKTGIFSAGTENIYIFAI
jgi:hypothetical protein